LFIIIGGTKRRAEEAKRGIFGRGFLRVVRGKMKRRAESILFDRSVVLYCGFPVEILHCGLRFSNHDFRKEVLIVSLSLKYPT